MPSVLLIITGSIAAYKALELARLLRAEGVRVTPVMTEGAKQFVTPLSFAALCESPVYDQLFSLKDEVEMGHIRLSRTHDLVVVAPASADFIAKMAQGRADDLASSVILASNAPIMLAPAMNPQMWQHPATQRNLAQVQADGVHLLEPAHGETACGEQGIGRMAEPAAILAAVMAQLCLEKAAAAPQSLAGKHALVTAGGTQEPIDPVRYITNRSSGKQGYAIAAALAERGARVTLVTANSRAPAPAGVTLVEATTASAMLAACESALPAEILIAAAAVADWAVEEASSTKIKKKDGRTPVLALKENPDILAHLCQHPLRPKLCIGFAAETEGNTHKLLTEASRKRQKKNCDWMVANDVSGGGIFGQDETTLHLLYNDEVEHFPTMSKEEAAHMLAERVAAFFA